MKLFFDTEFTGLTQNASLISLAIVDENDRTFYAEFTDYDPSQITDWLAENVLANLILDAEGEDSTESATLVKGTKKVVTESLTNWLSAYQTSGCQFVADVLMYDWVLFAELFGGALNLPGYIDFIPLDFSTVLFCRGIDVHTPRIDLLDAGEQEILRKISPAPAMHNALYDAYLLRLCFGKMQFQAT